MNDNIKAAIALLEAEGYTGITPPEIDYEPYRDAVNAYRQEVTGKSELAAASPMDTVDISLAKALISVMTHMPRKELTDEFLQQHSLAIINAWQSTKVSPFPAWRSLRNAINEAML
jgi:hypothetical protein